MDTFVSVVQEKFPWFIIKKFESNEIRIGKIHLNERYERHSNALPNTQKFHRNTNKVVGHFLTKTYPCHYQIQDKSINTISTAVGQFYKVRYHFSDGKYCEIVAFLPTMCSKNGIEEHLVKFLKNVRPNHSLLNNGDQA